ncbi:MAG TPA: hypothetical protein OIM45_02820 [Clostridiaceae bacterium]|nr:hypothetical protein [Clostridiaceae bacterium]
MAKYRVKQNLIKKLSANNLDDEKLILNISLEQEEKLNLTKEERGALIELRTAIRNKKDLFKFFISKDDDKDETEEQKEK